MNIKRLSMFLALSFLILTACSAKKVNDQQMLRSQGASNQKAGALAAPTQAPAIPMEKPVSGSSADQAGNAGQTTTSGDLALLNYQSNSARMVIKDAEIELMVENTDQAIDQVTQMAADYGGYLISSQSWFDGELKYATIRLAVPSQAFETALTNLRHIAVQVTKETGSGQDVSAEYTDLQSRLTNLEATAARVREFLNAAQTVDESLKVNQQLSDLEAQIEQVKGQMKYYEGRSAFSTITANLIPQRPALTPTPTATPTATPTPKPAWNPTNTFHSASGVLSTLFRATIDLLIWLIVVFGPFVVVLVVVILLLDRILHLRVRLLTSRRPSSHLPTGPSNSENL